MKKKHFTLQQHLETAKELFEIRNSLLALTVNINKHYPLPIAKICNRAHDAVDKLRCKLDDEIFKEFHPINSDDKGRIYYPGNTQNEEN